jgi:perosamine synthetase
MRPELARVLSRDLVLFMAPLPLRLLKRRGQNRHDLPLPFIHPHVCYPFSGTAAIYQGARALKLTANDRVLCPAYNCGHEIEPLLRQKVSVGFYSVNRQLEIGLSDLEKRIDRQTRAVLVTHYFGFPQPLGTIRELCDAHGLYLIEDCAHALFSKDPTGYLGTAGDIAVFSLRKTIPLPNGGALLVNRPGIETPSDLRSPHWVSTWIKILDLWKKSTLQHSASPLFLSLRIVPLALASILMGGTRILDKLHMLGHLALVDPDGEDFDFDSEILDWEIAGFGQRIIHNIDPEQIVKRRRENFQWLLDGLKGAKGCRSVFHSLPAGVCPLFFPLLVYNRDEVIWKLNQKGISAAKWWETFHDSVPWDEFPDAVFLKDHMIALPIHQDLTENHIQKIIDEFHRLPE